MRSQILTVKSIGLILGPFLALIIVLIGPPDVVVKISNADPVPLSFAAWATGALLVWMAIWWATEPIPIPATSLLPLVVLPLVGAGSPGAIASGYSSSIVLLLLGGFIIAMGIERWNLHKRIALNVVAQVGGHPVALIGGFMAATALLSMWISNTATTLMMVPIALSAASALEDKSGKFVTALLLGVCYAASIGGVATPIGTPTNLIALDFLSQASGETISFAAWMVFGVPTMLLLVPAAWWAVTRGLPKLEHGRVVEDHLRTSLSALGRMSVPEKRVAGVFACVALLWVTSVPVGNWLVDQGLIAPKHWSDMGIAIAGAVAMFLVPAGGGQKRALLSWEEAERLPWGVLLLFGGGIALGRAVSSTGLSAWIGGQLEIIGAFPPILVIASVVALVIFLTELTSNVATMTTLAPILAILAVSIGVAPASFLAPAAVAASCAFMLPVATAPNAIIYATGEVSVGQMMRKGFRINLIGVVIITAVGYWLAPVVL